MPLNRRQERSFQFVCDLYRPLPLSVTADNHAKDAAWPATPTYRLVRCRHQQAAEDNIPTVVGRGKGFFAENIDHFKFARDQDIEDGWLIHIRSAADADDGAFYTTQGSSSDRGNALHRRANQRSVSAIKVPKPPGVQPPPVTEKDLL